MSFLAALWANRNLILLGIAALAIAGFVWWVQDLRVTIADQEAQLTTTKASLAAALEANQENLAAFERLKADHQREITALNADLAGARQQTQTTTIIKEKIRHVPVPASGGTTACRPVGPHTLAALGELRGLTNPSGTDKDPASGSPVRP